MAINKYLSIININVNGLKVTIKRHGVTEWITNQDPYIYCTQENNFRTKDAQRLKVKGWKRIYHANGSKKY